MGSRAQSTQAKQWSVTLAHNVVSEYASSEMYVNVKCQKAKWFCVLEKQPKLPCACIFCVCVSSYLCWDSWLPPHRPGSSAPLFGWHPWPGLWRTAAPPPAQERPAPSWPWNPTSSCPLCSWSVSWKQGERRRYVLNSEAKSEFENPGCVQDKVKKQLFCN